MSVDLTSLLQGQRAIKVARADYDFARDGAGPFSVPINSEVIPSGSIIVGYAVYTSTGLTFSGASSLEFILQGQVVAIADATLGRIAAALYTGVAAFITTAERAIEGYISAAAATAGAATLWLFYLPTTA